MFDRLRFGSIVPPVLSLCVGFSALLAPAPACAQEVPGDGAITVLDDVVVEGPRRGATVFSPERELGAEEIDAYGADTIGDLVGELAPLIDGSDRRPRILVNGRRIGSPREIAGFPSDALSRAEILPPEAAARLGYPPGERVVNLVLERRFSSLEGQLQLSAPTAGGRSGEALNLNQSMIDNEVRWNVTASLRKETALLRSDRDLPGLAETAFDDDAFRTLQPETSAATLVAIGARPVGEFSAALTGGVDVSASRDRLGIGEPFQMLTSRQASANWRASSSLTGSVAGWSFNGDVGYVGAQSRGRTSRAGGGVDETSTLTHTLTAGLTGGRRLFELPAGPLGLSGALGLSRSHSASDGLAAGLGDTGQATARLNLSIPVLAPAVPDPGETRPRRGPPAGGLSASLGASATATGDEPAQASFDAGLDWSPFSWLGMDGRYARADATAPMDLLYAPVIETPAVRVYDFTRGETVEVTRVTGGGVPLSGGANTSVGLGLRLGPFTPVGLHARTQYSLMKADDAVGALPDPTPAFEAAFPDRFLRDADGRLVRIDARPINLHRQAAETLNTSLSLSTPLGSAPARSDAPSTAGPVRDRRARLQISLAHTWKLSDRVVPRVGGPELDRLAGDGGSGAGRHGVQLRLSLSRRRAGAALDLRWRSGGRTRRLAGVDGPDDLIETGLTVVDADAFLELGRSPAAGRGRRSDGVRLHLQIKNLFDAHQGATLGDGRVAPGYGRYERDSLGRSFQIVLGKRF